ncbi:thermonuclease family protein [Janibacter terrae]|uniref:Thermonuclease family protein n=1 Tax=Janibacter terrae TaxID=103817 RepID=A0ABZ2FJL3_9MICO
MIRRTAALAAAALVLSAPAATAAPAAPAVPKGSYAAKVVSVTDGDTIRIRYQGHSTPVRLIGLDAPEISPRECYGSQATSRMAQLTKGGTVYIRTDGTQGNKDRYGRLLRHVYTPGGTSLALTMIKGGYAREYTYSRAYKGQYSHRRAQSSAKAAARGLWGACARPKPTPTSTCVGKIKGNISSSGEKIYHVPGGRYYSVTKIDLGKGERWFCTETSARNAGWRKSKV